MKNNISVIVKKELFRFFSDKRMVLSTILLPGIMIYVIYSFMGSALTGMFTPDEDYKYTLRALNMPQTVSAMLKDTDFEISALTADEAEAAKAEVADKKLDILAVFPENFDADVASYESGSGAAAPLVEIYYNSTRTESASAHGMLISMLDGYESTLANKFDLNPGGQGFDLATERDSTGFMFSSMLPMLLMIFLFSGCVAIAPEAIAGEKERGTIATMLVTPMKRSGLAIGKIVALSVIALLSGASSTLGTLLALPKLMSGASGNMSAAVYGAGDYALLTTVILSTVLLLVAIISIISAYAKTIKEAQSAVSPLMIIVMLVGVTAMFGGGAKTEFYYYLIPIYNSVQAMAGIFSFTAAAQNILITVAVNLLLSVACGFVLTRMFNSEKVMFKK
ncbi:MAG: ABC transporter permease [Oscillospiraceae bacterium]